MDRYPTSDSITDITFKSKLGGYSKEEVKKYLQNISQSQTKMQLELIDIKKKNIELQEELLYYRKYEKQITETLIEAKKKEELMEKQTKDSSERLIQQAQHIIEDRIKLGNAEIEHQQQRIQELRNERYEIMSLFSQFLQEQTYIVNNFLTQYEKEISTENNKPMEQTASSLKEKEKEIENAINKNFENNQLDSELFEEPIIEKKQVLSESTEKTKKPIQTSDIDRLLDLDEYIDNL